MPAKKGLWANINRRKKAGTSRPKSKSTVTEQALKDSQKSSDRKSAKKGGGAKRGAKKASTKKAASKQRAAKK